MFLQAFFGNRKQGKLPALLANYSSETTGLKQHSFHLVCLHSTFKLLMINKLFLKSIPDNGLSWITTVSCSQIAQSYNQLGQIPTTPGFLKVPLFPTSPTQPLSKELKSVCPVSIHHQTSPKEMPVKEFSNASLGKQLPPSIICH